jgi:hypothetical protein
VLVLAVVVMAVCEGLDPPTGSPNLWGLAASVFLLWSLRFHPSTNPWGLPQRIQETFS